MYTNTYTHSKHCSQTRIATHRITSELSQMNLSKSIIYFYIIKKETIVDFTTCSSGFVLCERGILTGNSQCQPKQGYALEKKTRSTDGKIMSSGLKEVCKEAHGPGHIYTVCH